MADLHSAVGASRTGRLRNPLLFINLSLTNMVMRRLIVPISFAVMALAVAAMLPALVSAQTSDQALSSCYTFSRNMGVTSTGESVTNLTMMLNREGLLDGRSSVFDEDVAAAVVKFQSKYGIPTTGYVGPLTRAKLNSLYSCGSQNGGSSTQVRYECPPGYVCTPVGQNTSTTLCPVGYTCTANNAVHLENSTEKGDAAYNFFVTLLHRVPDTQGPGWNYFKYYSGSIDQMRQEFLSGIEYTTKQKISQIFRDVYKREPNDLELTKWYYVAEYNGYNTDVVRSAIGGAPVTTPSTYVTPVLTNPVYTQPSSTSCPAGFTCNLNGSALQMTPVVPIQREPARTVETSPAVSSGDPTASFTIEGEHSHTYNTGDTNHYAWSSTNADRFTSSYTATGGTVCGGGPWVANTSSGSSQTVISDAYAGCVWTVTYTATNSANGKSASDTVVVTVNPLNRSSTTSSLSGSRDAARP